MRSAVLLLTGFGLVVVGVALIALSGGLVLGIAAIVLGLLAKAAGFLLGDSPAATPGHGPQTLAGRRVERPRAGIPVGGRTAFRRGAPGRAAVRPIRAPRPSVPVSDLTVSDMTRPDEVRRRQAS